MLHYDQILNKLRKHSFLGETNAATVTFFHHTMIGHLFHTISAATTNKELLVLTHQSISLSIFSALSQPP